MDWGLGNPNITAAVIAMLMIAVWAPSFFRRWGFWVGLLPFTLLGICLVHTFSRGGLVAAAAGLGVLVLAAKRPWPRERLIAVGLSITVIILATIYLQAYTRYGQGIVSEDRSITNRLAIWKFAPAMMVGAPQGWGWGNAAQAFMQWYQPIETREEYRTLVNSHIVYLVEIGWPLRFLYLFVWGGILFLCSGIRKTPWMSVALGIWTCFGVASIFTHIGESLWVWVLPAISLLAVLINRSISCSWPRPKAWLISAAAASVICLALYISGRSQWKIQGSRNVVTIGNASPAVWIVIDRKTQGRFFGKAVRQYLMDHPDAPPVGLAESPTEISSVGDKMLVAGGELPASDVSHLRELASKASEITFLSPQFSPQELGLTGDQKKKVHVIFGEFTQSPAVSSWESVAQVHRIEGAGDFLPGWPKYLFFDESSHR